MDKSLEKSLTRWLKSQQKYCAFYINAATVLGVINTLILIFQAYLIASILQAVIIDQSSISSLLQVVYYLIACICVRALLAYAREQLSFIAGVKLRQQIRKQVLDKLNNLGPIFIQGSPVGSWASIVLEQIEQLQDFYSRYLPQMRLAVLIPLVILLVVFPINWASGLILLLTAPLIPLFMILVGWGAADANRKNFQALSRLSGYFLDRLKGFATLKVFYRADAELEQITKASDDFRKRTMSVLRLAFLNSAVLEFFAAVSIAVVAVYFGFSYLGQLNFGHYGQQISLLTGLFVLILAPEFYQPLRDLGTHYHAKAQAVAAAEALITLLDEPDIKQKGAMSVSGNINIIARDLSVYSHNGVLLLGPISFEIKMGEHIALVGISGAGKTSLINALLGFLPYQGRLTINDVELAEIDLCQWRKQIAWLGQNPQLFFGTLKQNIDVNEQNIPDESIRALFDKVQLTEFKTIILDYPIGEQGSGLSIGQAQRLALARALVSEPSLFLLDEPTASLDLASADKMMQQLHKEMQGKACLMVTHKLDKLSDFDQIWVMQAGQIVQTGNYANLSLEPGHFKDLLKEQRASVSRLLLEDQAI